VPRVAHERGAAEADIRRLVEAQAEDRQFGFFGEPRVNLLLLNLTLDQQFPRQGR
jgi:K+-transporting ATPase ATPase C chain